MNHGYVYKGGNDMDDLNNSIEKLVRKFILDDQTDPDGITEALERVFIEREFDLLGRAAYQAMLRKNIAFLRSKQAVLVAQLPIRRIN